MSPRLGSVLVSGDGGETRFILVLLPLKGYVLLRGGV